MRYLGSKRRIAKDILPIILKDRQPGQWYVEPFVGGANVIERVEGNRIGADKNPYLIALFKALQSGWIPPIHVTKEEYLHIKNNKGTYPQHLVGYVGFNGFGAKWFDSYRVGESEWSAHYNGVMSQVNSLRGIMFLCSDYTTLEFPIAMPDNSIIYCDPPYRSTTKYQYKIDYEAFYSWVKARTFEGHRVFISEYDMPKPFRCVWTKDISVQINAKVGTKETKTATEKLYTL